MNVNLQERGKRPDENPKTLTLEDESACPAPAGAALQAGHAPVEVGEVDLPLQSLTAAEMAELAPGPTHPPAPRHPTRGASDPVTKKVNTQVNTQIARVNALKDELQEADLSSERHRQLTIALHRETDALIRLRTAQHARDRAKDVPQVAPTTPPPPPQRARSGPLPEWLAKFVSEQAEEAAASS